MKIRKSQNHHALLLPVLLVLAAAFLATSLTFSGEGSEITGAVVNAERTGNCEWVNTFGKEIHSKTTMCPLDKSTVVSGGCDVEGYGVELISSNYYSDNIGQGWNCLTNSKAESIKASALCCKV